MSFRVSAAATVASALFLTALAYTGLATIATSIGAAALAVVTVLGGAFPVAPGAEAGRVSRQHILGGLATLILAGPLLVLLGDWRLRTSHRPWVFQGIAASLAAAALAVCLSSLVDWYFVAPRLRGAGERDRPCIDSSAGGWRWLTQVWLLHRAVAYTLVRVAFAAGVGVIVVGALKHVPTTTGSLIGATAAVLAAYYLNRVVPVFGFAINPALHVGDKVVLAEEYGVGVEERPVYYVVDVSIDGFQLLEVDEQNLDLPVASEFHRTHDRSVSLAEVQRLLRSRRKFRGCDRVCCRANHYCPLQSGAPTDALQREMH